MTPIVYGADGLVVVTFRRGVTFVEWQAILDSVFADPSFVRGAGILMDRRTAPVPETKDMREVVRYIDAKEASEETRGWAMVVNDLGSYGMGRMAQELSQNTNSIGVFQGMELANAWLLERRGQPTIPRRLQNWSVG